MWSLISIAALAAWFFGFWPFDGHTLSARDTKYAAEVGYYVGDNVQYWIGEQRKTLDECRSDADGVASYYGRNSASRIVSRSCLVYYNGSLDHRE